MLAAWEPLYKIGVSHQLKMIFSLCQRWRLMRVDLNDTAENYNKKNEMKLFGEEILLIEQWFNKNAGTLLLSLMRFNWTPLNTNDPIKFEKLLNKNIHKWTKGWIVAGMHWNSKMCTAHRFRSNLFMYLQLDQFILWTTYQIKNT